MAELKFKTRGMINPQGLPRVYFSCHPADFDRYFEMISDEILKKQNCAVFYYDDLTSYDEEELFLDLGQMQLFVMPVTTNLLIKENRAIDVEFKFAMEKHIPVLPLMQESGLEELFNKKCGDLQFLDRNVRDITAISYDEKLEKYLSSVLVGDELAAKVRAAFDAYVFLSYRKKDRKYAQELMRLIHKNDFCRDIAIWYDEFLTPGENFNDSIKDALNKSELFALVVTPNLVNETNYVMTTEYPMAKEENKLILPAEIVETDKNLLKEKYDGIPDCTDAHDEPALTESLVKLLENIAIKENDSSPEHNFFIGLAYLSGIDVEVDHERAVALITSAAEAGLPEAMEKLVAMYRNGEGVARSYETAIEWQEKYVDIYRGIYSKNEDHKIGLILLKELEQLSSYSYSVRNFEVAKKACEEILIVCKKILRKTNSVDAKSYVGTAYKRLGDIADAQGKFFHANEYYRQSLNTHLASSKKGDNRNSLIHASNSYDALGDLAKEENKFSEAKDLYLKAFNMRKKLDTKKRTARTRGLLAKSYVRLGLIEECFKNWEAAIKYTLDAISLREQLLKETNDVDQKRNLASYYLDLSRMIYTQTLESGKSNRNMSLVATVDFTMSEYLSEKGFYSPDFNEVIIHVKKFFNIVMDKNKKVHILSLGEAFKNLKTDIKSLAHNEGLNISDPQKYKCVHDGTDISIDFHKVIEYRKKALQLMESIAEETGMLSDIWSLSICYTSFGDHAVFEKRLKNAYEFYQKSLLLQKKLIESADTIQHRKSYANTLLNIGTVYKSKKRFNKARKYYREALSIFEAIVQESDTIKNKSSIAVCYWKLADLEKNNKRKEMLIKSLTVWDELCEAYPEMLSFSKKRNSVKAKLDEMTQ